jgi:hypothetical protein
MKNDDNLKKWFWNLNEAFYVITLIGGMLVIPFLILHFPLTAGILLALAWIFIMPYYFPNKHFEKYKKSVKK